MTRRARFIEEIEETWWRIWFSQVWDDLLTRGEVEESRGEPEGGRHLSQRRGEDSGEELVRDLQGS